MQNTTKFSIHMYIFMDYYSIGTLSLANQNRSRSTRSSMSFNGYMRVTQPLGLASPPFEACLEADAWLAVGRRPLGRPLPPRDPLRVRPRRRDRASIQPYNATHTVMRAKRTKM